MSLCFDEQHAEDRKPEPSISWTISYIRFIYVIVSRFQPCYLLSAAATASAVDGRLSDCIEPTGEYEYLGLTPKLCGKPLWRSGKSFFLPDFPIID